MPSSTRPTLAFPSGPGLALLAGLALAFAGAAAGRTAEPAPQVVVRTDQPDGRFLHERFTNATYGAAYGQTTAPLADAALQWVRASNALSYVRCWNWLGEGVPKDHPEWVAGCRVVRSGPGGQPVYQWEGLERVLDTLLAAGVKPFVVCGGLPDALAEGPVRRNESGAAVNRPRDYARYQDLIAQMFRRLQKTYGADEVRTWYFEVWSHPDHEGSWEGGRPAPFTGEVTAEQAAPFLRLYDHFAAAADSVDPKIRIGGPGLAGDRSFLRRFLEHCARGTSAATGRPGVRLGFVSWSRYGSVPDIVAWNRQMRGLVETEFPELKGLEYVLSEHGPSPTAPDRANEMTEAARLAALVDAASGDAKGADLLFRAGDLVDDHFNGSRALVTRIGENSVPLPAFRLYMLLGKMGAERLKTEVSGGVGAVAARPVAKQQRNSNQVLVYRYEPGTAPGAGEPVTVKVRFAGLDRNLLRLPARVYRIGAGAHAPYEEWVAAGRPRPAAASLGQKLAGTGLFPAAWEDPAVALRNGEAEVEVKLAPNETALVTLAAEPAYEAQVGARGKRLRKAEEEYALAIDAIGRRILPKAEEGFRRVAEKYADTFWKEVSLYSLVSLYEVEMKSPAQAEAARRELLALPLDDHSRLRLLERLRVDALRKQDSAGVASIGAEVRALEERLAALRRWELRRYAGE